MIDTGVTVKLSTCRRHNTRFYAACPACKQELFDIQARNERSARSAAVAPAQPVTMTVADRISASRKQIAEMKRRMDEGQRKSYEIQRTF